MPDKTPKFIALLSIFNAPIAQEETWSSGTVDSEDLINIYNVNEHQLFIKD